MYHLQAIKKAAVCLTVAKLLPEYFYGAKALILLIVLSMGSAPISSP